MEGRPRGLAGKEAFGAGWTLSDGAAKWRGFLKALRREWTRHKLGEAAAALTFYGVLALFPFLLLIVALAGIVLQPDRAHALVGVLGREAPPAFAQLPVTRLAELTSGPSRGLLTFSGLTAIWSATAGVVSLMAALNAAYDVAESRPRWKVYGVALGVMLTGAVLSVLAALFAVAGAALALRLGSPWRTFLVWLRLPVAALMMMALWALLYAVLPNVQRKSRLITPGAVVGVLVWLTASLGFSFYVSHFSTFGVTYGALGGVIVLLLWMWISALALMLGAEINAILTQEKRRRADARTHPAKELGPPRQEPG